MEIFSESFYHEEFFSQINYMQTVKVTGADLGKAGGGADAPPQGFDPLPTQMVPILVLFQKSIFGRPNLKFF